MHFTNLSPKRYLLNKENTVYLFLKEKRKNNFYVWSGI
ncbi:hypothetical protein M092_1480 [Parabacteroides distasonis str. 3776 D15 iv]|uniref:Uncharacterized protein n=1 Tax=Parabacteroides distasonis str. 3776 D15 i TaxID=1339342 RepID=A0AB34LBF9_PARDI|nr:hypothetical protein M091_2597 [Parabacteroides distasonis str. 3776 D15 i]KDS53123.1 hypothetical protein M090_1671 [Parabacteroides distasonis str. 3776 Po2 i]KDS67639.1 hypothetical protein M095_2186 [Parabacteroides distasonis str. 3999B T(B) 4]KDS72725.1 hypothetical protein M092_1480 [Parabacteroides distasonis str. 3776 D15 iv]KDS76386.1 hypothetical protein M096_1385 [Parabacteroides distasonis str. 3999B T(B) 6]